MRVTTTTRIASPAENVFDMLADLRNDSQWNSRVSRAELVSPNPSGWARGSPWSLCER